MRQYLDILNEVDEDETSKPARIYVTSNIDNKYLGLIAKNPNEYNTQEAKQVHENALEVLTKYAQYISGGESTVNELSDKTFRFNGLLVDELEAAKRRAEARKDDPAAAELQETVYGYVHYATTANQWNGEPPVESKELDELLTVMFGERYYFMSKEDIATRLEQEKSMFKSIELTNAPMNDDMQVQKEIVDRLDAIVSDDNRRLVWSNVGQDLDTDLGDDDSDLETGTSDAVSPGRPTTDDGTPNDAGEEPDDTTDQSGFDSGVPTTGSGERGGSGPTGDTDGFDDGVPTTGSGGRGSRGDQTEPYQPDVDVDADQDFDGDVEDFGPGTGGSGRGDGSSEADRRNNDSKPTPYQQDYNVDADQDFDGDVEDFGPGGTGTGRGSGSSEVDRRTSDASDETGVVSGAGTGPSYNVDADQDFYGDADGFGPGTGGTGRGAGSGEVSRRAADSATGTGRGSGSGETSRRAADSVTGTGRGSGSAETGRRASDSKPKDTAPATSPAQPEYDVERVLQRSGTTTNMNVSKYRNKSPYVISNFSGGRGKVGKIYGKQQNLAKFFPGKTIYTEAATVDLKDHINKL